MALWEAYDKPFSGALPVWVRSALFFFTYIYSTNCYRYVGWLPLRLTYQNPNEFVVSAYRHNVDGHLEVQDGFSKFR